MTKIVALASFTPVAMTTQIAVPLMRFFYIAVGTELLRASTSSSSSSRDLGRVKDHGQCSASRHGLIVLVVVLMDTRTRSVGNNQAQRSGFVVLELVAVTSDTQATSGSRFGVAVMTHGLELGWPGRVEQQEQSGIHGWLFHELMVGRSRRFIGKQRTRQVAIVQASLIKQEISQFDS